MYIHIYIYSCIYTYVYIYLYCALTHLSPFALVAPIRTAEVEANATDGKEDYTRIRGSLNAYSENAIDGEEGLQDRGRKAASQPWSLPRKCQ